MIDITKINTKYRHIEKIKDNKDKLIIYWKESHNKTLNKLSFMKQDDYYVANFINCYQSNSIKCKEECLVDEINKQGFETLTYAQQYLDKFIADKKKAEKVKRIKSELMSTLKPGDLVERIGKTPNNGYYIIEVESFNDYGVTGFYLNHNLKRSMEYTQVSWCYIKGICKEDN